MNDFLAGLAGVVAVSGLSALGGLLDRTTGLSGLLAKAGPAKPVVAGAIGISLAALTHGQLSADSLATVGMAAPFGTLAGIAARAAIGRIVAARRVPPASKPD